ncbi:hypothetical protein [Xanthomonas dyei]|uniref:hypothetical protein n=1 Tax=Xanthomonas dyei TaxID=743699 RepID=UPI001E50492D|nr:hypothetical protein [Xanthomonas dyei]MCC4632651.1 hypothetical protein [Xanthomonas dyei pv. eucalypti]
MAQGKKDVAVKVTVAQAVRDVLITSMNKGQLPLLAVCSIVFLIAYRLTPEATEKLAREVVARMVDLSILGWVLTLGLSFGWWFHSKSTRERYKVELARIGQEKSAAQNVASGGKFAGSRTRR